MTTTTRFNIIGTEVCGLGGFLLTILTLQLVESHFDLEIEKFAWVYGIIGITLILVGLETLSLVKSFPRKSDRPMQYEI
jgi:hypothetical protein